MKLVINGYFLSKPKTGIGQYLLQILSHQKWNFDIIILLPSYLRDETKDISKVIKHQIQYVQNFYSRNDLLAQFMWEKFIFPREVSRQKANVVWSPQPTISVIPNIKHIMTVHDVIYWRLPEYIPNWKMKIYVKLLGLAIKKADQIITISKFSAKEISSIFNIPFTKIPIITPASPRIRLENNTFFKKESRYIFYAGGLDIRKNVPRLIEAFSIIESQYDNLKLYISGNYFSSPIIPDLLEIIKDYALEDKVKLLGYISDEDLVNYTKNADILAYPSLYEGFGIPILEGLSLGTPVITSNIGAMKEVGEDSAVLVNPYSAKSIAKGISSILDDDLLRQSLIVKGINRSLDFNWEKSANKLGKLFQSYH
ncbi:MAG: hypothetical protein RLZZ223_368 [Candidatus Parcubacteria bacterium]|jgi:glycosyltransferase involved in cell wall biosynthesis